MYTDPDSKEIQPWVMLEPKSRPRNQELFCAEPALALDLPPAQPTHFSTLMSSLPSASQPLCFTIFSAPPNSEGGRVCLANARASIFAEHDKLNHSKGLISIRPHVDSLRYALVSEEFHIIHSKIYLFFPKIVSFFLLKNPPD